MSHKRLGHKLLTEKILESPVGQMVANILIQGSTVKIETRVDKTGDLIHRIEAVCTCGHCLVNKGVSRSILMYKNLQPDYESTQIEEARYNQQQ